MVVAKIELNQGKAEFIGALIGDGYVYRRKYTNTVGIVGSPKTDAHYFEYLKSLIYQEFGIDVKIRYRERGLRIVFGSKDIVDFLCDDLGMAFGKNKSERIFIPLPIMNDIKLTKSAIRGIADTDGSIFVSNKPGSPKYPSIEITTASLDLAKQLRSALISMDFKVANFWGYLSKNSKRVVYRVPLNGKLNVKRWVEEIGFSNPYKFKRALEYIR